MNIEQGTLPLKNSARMMMKKSHFGAVFFTFIAFKTCQSESEYRLAKKLGIALHYHSVFQDIWDTTLENSDHSFHNKLSDGTELCVSRELFSDREIPSEGNSLD